MKKTLLRWLLAAFFVATGLNHFLMPEMYAAMIPHWMPWPAGLSAIAGIWKILGGGGVLYPRFRAAAGWSLIALLVAVFPANLHVALMGRMPGFDFPPAFLWLRLAFQAVLAAWIAWVAIWEDRPQGR